MKTALQPAGLFRLTFRDRDGRLRWTRGFANGPTNEGLDYVGGTAFRGQSRSSPWYIGIIDNAGFVQLDPTDGSAAHAGWAEYTGVFGGLRGTWNPVASVAGFIDCVTATTIQITAAGTVRGAFLANRQAVGLASGSVIYATGIMTAGLAVSVGGTLSITYQLRFARG